MAHITKIYGPPGTGKTTRLIQILKKELDSGVPAHEIAYLSHTRAAADVIKERFAEGDSRGFPWFRTIHSASARLIGIKRNNIMDHYSYKQFSAETGMPITTQGEMDMHEDYSELTEDYSVVLAALHYAEATCRELDDVISERGLSHPCLTRERRESFIENWRSFKAKHGKLDFTDMLLSYLAQDEAPPLPCSVVFIDEAQDLSELQWRVAEKMFANADRIYMAGDDDQAIYGFIGGSEDGFYRYPAQEEIVLETSYRVPEAIGRSATKIIRKISQRKDKTVAWKKHDGQIERASYDITGAPWAEWRAQGKSVMVLSRHRKNAKKASQALTNFGIPHAGEGLSVLERPEAKIAHSVWALKNGQKIRPRYVADMYRAAGMKEPEMKMRSLSARSRSAMVGIDDLVGIDLWMKDWPKQFAKNPWTLKHYEQLRKIVNENGIGVLENKSSVLVCTMHAAKGREADIVIIDPDCTSIVKKNILRPAEIRLAYVTLTRAKEKAIVLAAKTDTFIDHLVNA